MRLLAILAFLLTLTLEPALADDGKIVTHGLAMHGEPKYPADFRYLEYVNPDAPKGGSVKLAATGTFDTLHGFILKGVAAQGTGLVMETLLTGTADEAFSEYGLIAETIEVPKDRSWVAFKLRKEARWHDGKPMTTDDVIFSFNALMEKGHPHYRSYYANVKKAEATDERTVKFTFDGGDNRELPLIMGQMPILPKHYWQGRDFSATTLDPPLGSGPYRVADVSAGRSITYERVPDYWGKDLPINRGRYNFDRIGYDYYRDATVALQAFFGGQYDFRQENTAKDWATAYDVPPVKNGLIKREEIAHDLPTGMQAFVYNTRREIFADPKIRYALAYAFDFEWSNKNLAFGAYTRTKSYFSNSELASEGVPQGQELKILEKYRGRVPEEVFTKVYAPPQSDGSGNIRGNLKIAVDLLKKAGWEVRDKRMVNVKSGKPLKFEIVDEQPAFERWVQPFIGNLQKIGVEANFRVVDTAQYKNRMDEFDFDMTIFGFGQSLSPGNEQRDYWASSKADVKGSRNLIGIKNPVVDELIDLIISAPDRESLITACRALDRVLLWNHYVIPHWHIDRFRLAYWNKFGHPKKTPRYGLGFPETWWIEAAAERELTAKQQEAVKQ
jgi:microcin C transport system substrate-binding protein